MKAAVWNGPYNLSIQEVPCPTPSEGEVLIRTKAVGICGSDLEIYDGRFTQCKPPLTIGHEGGGQQRTQETFPIERIIEGKEQFLIRFVPKEERQRLLNLETP